MRWVTSFPSEHNASNNFRIGSVERYKQIAFWQAGQSLSLVSSFDTHIVLRNSLQMTKNRYQAVLFRIGFVMLASFGLSLLTACSSRKLIDCQKLLAETNSIVTKTQNVVQSEQGREPDDLNLDLWLKAADSLSEGAQAIANLDIKEETLKDYQLQIGQVYNDQAQATYTMVKARQDRNLEAALNAQKLSAEAGKRETTIGNQLNSYCQDPDSAPDRP